MADKLPDAETATLGDTLVDVEAKVLLDTLADKLIETKAKKLGYQIGDVKAGSCMTR